MPDFCLPLYRVLTPEQFFIEPLLLQQGPVRPLLHNSVGLISESIKETRPGRLPPARTSGGKMVLQKNL